MDHFSAKVCEQLGYYVYLYIDPRNDVPFYVGKGKRNRAFGHLNMHGRGESEKIRILKELKALGLDPKIELLKYGLTEKEALLVESTAIDLLGIKTLSNKVHGHGSRIGGRGLATEIAQQLNAKPVKIKDPVILINIARAYRYGISPHELYDVTRCAWKLNHERHPDAKYALSIYRGVVREVYEIAEWVPGGSTMRLADKNGRNVDQPGRYEFVGRVADEPIRHKYLGKSVTHHFSQGAQNPVMYVNC